MRITNLLPGRIIVEYTKIKYREGLLRNGNTNKDVRRRSSQINNGQQFKSFLNLAVSCYFG